MEKTQIGRQIIEGTKNIRIYNSKLLLSSKKKLPIITKNELDIVTWIAQNEQIRIHTEFHKAGGLGVLDALAAPEPDHAVVEAILDLPGVAAAIPAGYQLVVIKAEAFAWSDIEKHILLLLSSFSLSLDSLKSTDAGSDSNPKTS